MQKRVNTALRSAWEIYCWFCTDFNYVLGTRDGVVFSGQAPLYNGVSASLKMMLSTAFWVKGVDSNSTNNIGVVSSFHNCDVQLPSGSH